MYNVIQQLNLCAASFLFDMTCSLHTLTCRRLWIWTNGYVCAAFIVVTVSRNFCPLLHAESSCHNCIAAEYHKLISTTFKPHFIHCTLNCLCLCPLLPVVTRWGSSNPAVWTCHPPETHSLQHGEPIYTQICGSLIH